MPVFNAEAFLGAAIASILDQTFADFELIVVDDGSADGSCDIARQFRSGDSRVRLVALTRDTASRSGARASNVGLDLVRGAYVARMDADDVSRPDRFEKQLPVVEAGADIVGSGLLEFGESTGDVVGRRTPPTDADEIRQTALSIRRMLALLN